MRAEIRTTDPTSEFDTAERCHIIEIGNDDGDEQVSVARARVEPGVTTAWHRLDGISERYLILTGTGRVEIGDDIVAEVGPGDLVRIPAGTRQRISNTGSEDLIFYAICAPRFRQENYQSLE